MATPKDTVNELKRAARLSTDKYKPLAAAIDKLPFELDMIKSALVQRMGDGNPRGAAELTNGAYFAVYSISCEERYLKPLRGVVKAFSDLDLAELEASDRPVE